MRRPLSILLIMMLAATATAACDRPASPAASPGPNTVAAAATVPTGFPNGLFRATGLVADGAPKALVNGTALTVRFRPKAEIEVYAGCNTIGYKLRFEGERFIPTEAMSTLIGCLDERADQDAWLRRFFGAGPTWTKEGEVLVLRVDRSEIRLVDAALS